MSHGFESRRRYNKQFYQNVELLFSCLRGFNVNDQKFIRKFDVNTVLAIQLFLGKNTKKYLRPARHVFRLTLAKARIYGLIYV